MSCVYLWIIIVISQNNLLKYLYEMCGSDEAIYNNVQLEFIFNAACLLWLLSGYVCH